MKRGRLCAIEWRLQDEILEAIEPTPQEVESSAAVLAGYYNDAHNRRMMGHSVDLSVGEVVSCYGALFAQGARPFLLRRGGEGGSLIGDADIRRIADGAGEFAILIGDLGLQGRGFGRRFAVMMHAFAFRGLGLRRLYVSIVPDNAASRRLLEKLGYERDDRPKAREFADDQTDVTMSVDRERFEGTLVHELSQIRIQERQMTILNPHDDPD